MSLVFPNYIDTLTLTLPLVVKSITVSNQAVDVIGKFGNGGSSIYVEAKIKEATKKVADIAYLVFDIFIHDNCNRSYKPKTCESTKEDPIQSMLSLNIQTILYIKRK